MSYVATIPVEFPCSVREVYAAMCDLSSYPVWNNGMTAISHAGQLREGLQYEATSTLPGGLSSSSGIKVTRMVANEEIVLENFAGLIAYQVTYQFRELGARRCEVTCLLKFEFRNYVLNLARSAIEGMAEARMRGDLETLRAMICESDS